MKNPAAGGGRWVEVPPERLVSWIAGFARRHGGVDGPGSVTRDESGTAVTFTAADGAVAQCHPPFPPAPAVGRTDPAGGAQAIVAHAGAGRAAGGPRRGLGGCRVGVSRACP